MTCKTTQERLHLFVDQELDQQEADRLMKHIKNCVECSLEIASLEHLKEQFAAMTSKPVPDSLYTTLLNMDTANAGIFELSKDIFRVVFRNAVKKFHISDADARRFHAKYSPFIQRWILFC